MPGSPYPQSEIRKIVDRAIQQQEVDSALGWAKELKSVGLDQALALTLLLGREGDARFERAARRFLARFAEEADPTLGQIKKVADALDTLGHTHELPAMREGADRALEDLARQLRDRSSGRRALVVHSDASLANRNAGRWPRT